MNFMVLVTYLFFNLPAHQDLQSILHKYMNGAGKPLALDRDLNMTDEIIRDKNDENFLPTRHDLVDICTIGKINPAKMM